MHVAVAQFFHWINIPSVAGSGTGWAMIGVMA